MYIAESRDGRPSWRSFLYSSDVRETKARGSFTNRKPTYLSLCALMSTLSGNGRGPVRLTETAAVRGHSLSGPGAEFANATTSIKLDVHYLGDLHPSCGVLAFSRS